LSFEHAFQYGPYWSATLSESVNIALGTYKVISGFEFKNQLFSGVSIFVVLDNALIFTFVNAKHPANILGLISITLAGITTFFKFWQDSNNCSPITSSPSGNVIAFKAVALWKARAPISFKVLGRVTSLTFFLAPIFQLRWNA
jgi:hypothetical protein